MSAQLLDAADGLITISIRGILSQAELAKVQEDCVPFLRAWGQACMLVRAEQFGGWTQGDNWMDFSFQFENDPYIRKIAIVGEPRWKDLVFLFTSKKTREFPIEFFESAELDRARAWLNEP